jgi:diguanylate cyclase (GGDEF)-like protein/PAS domain S-box-containing protein
MFFSDEPEICRDILESLPTGMCVVDLQKRIVFWSDGAERITGRLRHEVIGRSCVSEPLLHCDQPGCEFCSEECPLARAMKTSQPTDASGLLLHHKSGHELPVRIRAVPIHNQRGSILGAVATFEDLEIASNDRQDGARLPVCVDEVTGVATRAMVQAQLRETFAAFADTHVPFGILQFRLEGLEHFRAAFGTEAASSLLRVIARTLESALWKTDFVGRWTDDQFLVILNGCREAALYSVRERVRHMLANDSIDWWGDRRSLPVATGQATAQPDDTIESILDRAQKSLEGASVWHSASAGSNPLSGS